MSAPAHVAWNSLWNMGDPEWPSRMAYPIVTTCRHHPACYSHRSYSLARIYGQSTPVLGATARSTGHLRPLRSAPNLCISVVQHLCILARVLQCLRTVKFSPRPCNYRVIILYRLRQPLDSTQSAPPPTHQSFQFLRLAAHVSP